MKRKEDILLDNDTMLADVYNNPVYKSLLIPEQVTKAKNALCDIAIKMKNIPNKAEDQLDKWIKNIDSSCSLYAFENSDEFDFEK